METIKSKVQNVIKAVKQNPGKAIAIGFGAIILTGVVVAVIKNVSFEETNDILDNASDLADVVAESLN